MSANAAECPPANAPVSVRRRKMHTVIGIIVSLGHTEILDKLPFDVLGNPSRKIVLPDGGAELTEHSGHHYCICTRGDIDSFSDAENFCERIGGHLAVINDVYENAFLYDTYFGPYPHKTNSAYFGYTCENDGETWCWVDDSKSEYEGGYQNWKDGEPNCYNGKKEYYALFWHLDPDYTWNSGDFGKEPPEDGTVTFLIEWEELGEKIDLQYRITRPYYDVGVKSPQFCCLAHC